MVESLEPRQMLDGASSTLPPAIVVGRTLSSYFAGGVQNHQVTITYTVYNEQADPETGVLLTTTLKPGVTVAGASQPPSQNGPNLAWSLGTIPGYDRASVTLTVALTDPIPTELDTGATAYATLNAAPVSDTTPVATLRPGNVAAPTLLASTADANITDPFIQEEAARLDYDSQNIFDFLHTEIGYNSYNGSVRGARGTLWSSAGNALDVASLGVALMRASGIPAQYVQGNLPFNLVQQLILSMFPASAQTLGFVPNGNPTANPANDSRLLNETTSHSWFQFDDGSGMKDADPLLAGAAVGQTFATSTGTFAEVPDALREKTTVTLDAEIYSQAGALFGLGNGLSTTTVLSQVFNDVDLVGRPISIGNYVSNSAVGALVFSVVTNTYTPYFDLGDVAYPDGSRDEVITGTPYQEVMTNFPLGSQVLTGLFLKMSLSGPQGTAQDYEHTIFDRIGYAARQTGGAPSISVDPNGKPALSDLSFTTIYALPGLIDQTTSARLGAALRATQAQLAALEQPDGNYAPGSETVVRQAVIDQTRMLGAYFMEGSDTATAAIAVGSGVAAYFDRPRLVLASSTFQPPDQNQPAHVTLAIDLRRDDIRALAAPGQVTQAVIAFQLGRGIMESVLEGQAVAGFGAATDPVPVSAGTVFQAASAQHVALATIGSANLSSLQTLDLPSDARGLIAAAVNQGLVVIVPVHPVTLNGQPVIAWFQVDPATGQTIGVTPDGNHQGIVEYVVTLVKSGSVAVANNINSILAQLHVPPNKQINHQNVKNYLGNTAIVLDLSLVYASFYPAIYTAAFFPPLFYAIAITALIIAVIGLIDPSVAGVLAGIDFPQVDPPNLASGQIQTGGTASAGAVAGEADLRGVTVAGPLSASWASTALSSFQNAAVAAGNATVRDARGNLVGTGTVQQSRGAALAIGGNNQFSLNGNGSLSFYGPAETTLGASGDWQSYSAIVSGNVSLSLNVPDGVLSLNGNALPAGSYTITAGTAMLSGSGATSSPTFAGAATLTSTGATVEIGPGSAGLSVGGTALDPTRETTLAGFTGNVTVTARGNGTDHVALSGSAANVLSVGSPGASLSTDQNTPLSFQTTLSTSLAGTYALSAIAPPGWTVAIDATGKVTVTPMPGLQGGTFPIVIVARSQADSKLVAQTTAQVAITPTQPGIRFTVDPDAQLTVPQNTLQPPTASQLTGPQGGAQLPTAFRASVANLGPAADTYRLTFSNVPAGFTLLTSGTSATVPAGRTGILGLYLQPNAGQPLPAPGTQLSFQVTATSLTDSSISQTQTVTFTVPAIDAVTLASGPAALSTTPGTPVSATITITNAGNVAENNITLSVPSMPGLLVSGFTPVSLQPGESTTQTVTITPDSSTPLGSRLEVRVSAAFGTSGSPRSQSLVIALQVVAPGVAAIARASDAAGQAGNTALASRLNDLSTALSSLFQSPSDPVARGQATANLDSLVTLVINDPFLSGFSGPFAAARTAIAQAASPADVQAALTSLGNALGAFAQTVADEGAHGFTIGLEPARIVVQPGVPSVFSIDLKNTGSQVTTYDLSISTLPAGVSAGFSQTKITLNPGQEVRAGAGAPTLTMTQTGSALVAVAFSVTATAEAASGITLSTPGALTLRDTFLQVAAVTTSPPFVPSGASGPSAQVQVSARIQSALNQPQSDTISYVVLDPTGNVVFTSTPVPLALATTSALVTADLGTFDTTGLPDGNYTLIATIADAAGQPIAGSAGEGTIVVGLPVRATVTTTPTTVPTGKDIVTTTVQVHGNVNLPSPLNILGQVNTGDNELSTVLFGNTLAYVVGLNGVSIVDVSDPTNPTLAGSFAQTEIVQGGYNIAQVVGNDLIVATTVTLNASGFNFIVYDLTDPLHPTLVSNTPINQRFLGDMYILGDVALVTIGEIDFFGGGSIFAQLGNTIALDISDLAHPTVAGVLFGPGDPEINHPEGGAVIVNSQVAYVVSSTSTGGDTQHGVGRLRRLDISDPAHPTLAGTLDIPGTVTLTGIALQGNRALVAGSTGGLLNPFGSLDQLKNTGNLTLTVLDISDPNNPVILGNTLVTEVTFPASSVPTRGDLRDLGNGLFAQSAVESNGKPALLLIDASDPSNIIVSALNPPTNINGLTVSGHTLYAGTPVGLSIYDIGQLVSQPVTLSVDVPKDGPNASLVAGSFDKPPTQIIHGASFDTYVWNRSLAFGNTDLSFSWRTQQSGLAAGDTRDVTLGTTVGFVSQGTPGTLTLPGTTVTAAPIIAISPATQSEQPGGTATYVVRLTNPLSTPVTYNVFLPFLASVTATLEKTVVTVAGNSSTDIVLRLTSDPRIAPGSYPFTVTATNASDSGVTGSASATLQVAGVPIPRPAPSAHGLVASLTPAEATAGQGTAARFVVRVTNTGSDESIVSFSIAGLPQNVSARFGNSSLDVLAGVSNFRDVPLELDVPRGTPAGSYSFTVTATNDVFDTSTVSGTLVVTTSGVDVLLNPSAGAPGRTFQATITNTGTVQDTFDLTLAGPAALVSSLGTTRLSLAPGASQTVAITTGAASFAIPGKLDLTVIATSVASAAVKDGDSATLDVAPSRAVTAQFSPGSKTLSGPGSTSFDLVVTNTGNTEDSYEAIITGTQGPVSASLLGLDGLPTQVVRIFRLPALATGVLELQANLMAALQQGLITVMVRSTTNPSIAVSVTASVQATSSSTPTAASRTLLSIAPSTTIVVGQTVTLNATVRDVGGRGTPTGTVTFLDGSKVLGTVRVDAKGHATLRLTTAQSAGLAARAASLGVGTHHITAVYHGDPAHRGSKSTPATLVVKARIVPTSSHGPTVTGVLRYGYHAQPTVLVLRFSHALDPVTAQDPRNYTIVNLGGTGRGGARAGHRVRVKTAVYDASTFTVTLHPLERLDLRNQYRLTIHGSAKGGVSDAAGHLLDGLGSGKPGSDFSVTITRALLAGATRADGSILSTVAVANHATGQSVSTAHRAAPTVAHPNGPALPVARQRPAAGPGGR